MPRIFARKALFLGAVAMAFGSLGSPALAEDELKAAIIGVQMDWIKFGWGIAAVAVSGVVCAKLVGPKLCLGGAVLAAGGKAFANDAQGPAADPQGQRVANYEGLPTTFSGVATDTEEAVSYSGVRAGAMLQGQYTSSDASGTFQGVLQRNGSISGSYNEPGESGVFAGVITPQLDQLFGTATCTSGCDEDD